MIWSLKAVDVQLATRAAVAAGLATAVAQLLALPHPIYAMISAVLVTDLVAAQTRQLALPRLAATALGTVLGALLSQVLPPGPWAVVIGILAAMLLADLLWLRHAARVGGYICGIVLIEHVDRPWAYAFARMVETLLGIGAAVLVSLVPKLVRRAGSPDRNDPA